METLSSWVPGTPVLQLPRGEQGDASRPASAVTWQRPANTPPALPAPRLRDRRQADPGHQPSVGLGKRGTSPGKERQRWSCPGDPPAGPAGTKPAQSRHGREDGAGRAGRIRARSSRRASGPARSRPGGAAPGGVSMQKRQRAARHAGTQPAHRRRCPRASAGAARAGPCGPRRSAGPVRGGAGAGVAVCCGGVGRAGRAGGGVRVSYLPGRGDSMIRQVVFPGRGSSLALRVC